MSLIPFAYLIIFIVVALLSDENGEINRRWCPFVTPYNKSMLKIGYENCEDGFFVQPTNGKVRIKDKRFRMMNQTIDQTGLFHFNVCRNFPHKAEVLLTVQDFTKSLIYEPYSVVEEELETKLCQKNNMVNFHEFIHSEMPLKHCLSRIVVRGRGNSSYSDDTIFHLDQLNFTTTEVTTGDNFMIDVIIHNTYEDATSSNQT